MCSIRRNGSGRNGTIDEVGVDEMGSRQSGNKPRNCPEIQSSFNVRSMYHSKVCALLLLNFDSIKVSTVIK